MKNSTSLPSGSIVKDLPDEAGKQVSIPREGPLEEEMVTHSSVLAWEIPWTEEPGGLQSMRSQRVRHNSAVKQQQQTSLHSSGCYRKRILGARKLRR